MGVGFAQEKKKNYGSEDSHQNKMGERLKYVLLSFRLSHWTSLFGAKVQLIS